MAALSVLAAELLLRIAHQHDVGIGVAADHREFAAVGRPVIVPDMLSLE